MRTRAIRKTVGAALSAVFAAATMMVGAPTTALADPGLTETPLYFLDNPYTEECFFTVDKAERDSLEAMGWTYDWVPMYVPTDSSSPVYRLYNPNNDDHLFTRDLNEYNTLANSGWQQEGVKFYSEADSGVAMYRVYNPLITGPGSHSFSTNQTWASVTKPGEGWSYEGAKWYGTRKPVDDAEKYQGTWYGGIYYADLGSDLDLDQSTPPLSAAPILSGEGHPEVVDYARQWIGWPYVSCGESPEEGGFDCCGLTQWVYKHFGVNLPRTTWEQMAWLQSRGTWTTDVDQLKPGDLIVLEYGGHVAIYAGKNANGEHMMIDAPNPQKLVQERVLYAVYPGALSGNSFLGGGSVL